MDCPPKKIAVVERWPSVEFRLYPHHTLYDWKLKLCYTNALRLCHEDYFAPCCMLPIDSPTVSFPQLVHVKSWKKTVGGSFQFT